MIQIPSSQLLPELSGPSLPQAIRFFSPRQKKILIIASIIFLSVVILSSAGFYFWLTSFKKSRVDFNILGPTQVSSGESVTYQISYWNNTNQILQNAILAIRYPQDSLVTNGKSIQNIDLGNIGVGGGGKQEVSLAFIGLDKSIQKLQATLSYKPQNTTSTFENEAVKEVAINGSALIIDFKAPENVLPNTRNSYLIYYKNNSNKVFENVSIEGKGIVVTYTIITVPPAGYEKYTPYAWVIMELDGVDLRISGFMRNIKSPSDLPLGTKAKVSGYDELGIHIEKL